MNGNLDRTETCEELTVVMDSIFKHIPHRPPFLFIDTLVESGPDRAVARRTWNVDEAFYAGHYPGNPLTPGVLLCEALFQTGALFLSRRGQGGTDSPTSQTPVLSRIKDARFKQIVRPGETVTFSVSLVEQIQHFYFMKGKAENEAGKTVLTLEFALALVPGEVESKP